MTNAWSFWRLLVSVMSRLGTRRGRFQIPQLGFHRTGGAASQLTAESRSQRSAPQDKSRFVSARSSTAGVEVGRSTGAVGAGVGAGSTPPAAGAGSNKGAAEAGSTAAVAAAAWWAAAGRPAGGAVARDVVAGGPRPESEARGWRLPQGARLGGAVGVSWRGFLS